MGAFGGLAAAFVLLFLLAGRASADDSPTTAPPGSGPVAGLASGVTGTVGSALSGSAATVQGLSPSPGSGSQAQPPGSPPASQPSQPDQTAARSAMVVTVASSEMVLSSTAST